jgi:hypothetical protein
VDDGLPDDLAAELWRRGELSYKLRPHQRDLYGLLNGLATRTAFIDCARRFGKSFTALLWCVEQGLRRELLVRFAAPTQRDLEEIYHPIMETICEDAPEELCPVWRTTKGRGHYFFPSTGSKLYMFGTDARNYKKGRGKATDIAIFRRGRRRRQREACRQEHLPPADLRPKRPRRHAHDAARDTRPRVYRAKG